MFAFAVSVYARIYREEITENFTVCENEEKKTGVEEKLLSHSG